MFKSFAAGIFLSLVGMAAGLLIVWWAVSTWTELSTHWLNSALVLPVLGMVGGVALLKEEESRVKLRALLALAAAPICGASNYLAFIITSRTWFASEIPLEHQSFFYQIANPDMLPAFGKVSSTGAQGSAESWLMYLIIGCVVGPFAVWFTTRK